MNLLAAQNTSLKNEGPMHRQMNDLQNQQICSVIQQQQVRRLQGTSIEKKKPVSDDYVKIIRQKGVTNNNINVKVPVPLAYICDPDFKPCSEEQIIHQFRQNRRCDDDVRKAMTFLSKMLAEKRVFGTKLMAQTTVAGPNHSIYKNLPEEGIYYIAHVCRKVMQHRIPNEDEFWEVFRDVTRKLAARCRRVRHSKKVRADDKSNGTIQTNKREEVALDISPDSLATESDDVIKTSDFTVEREKIDKYEEI
ncbi:hypothetical protein AB6A40_009055 [Gnathostoma spinigerum]|uniref:Uncharacterized protein n=1 Tax=Gnathostoma spinigerum TaxID=75299 RepID=A0ABD6EXY7_9BILA